MSNQIMIHEAVRLSIYSIKLKEVYEACKRVKDSRRSVQDENVYFQSAPGKAVARITNHRDILLIDLDVEENEEGTGTFSIPLSRLKELSASSIDMVHFKAAENEAEVTVLAENGTTAVEDSVQRRSDEVLPGSGLLKGAEFHDLDEDEFLSALHAACHFTEDGKTPGSPLSAVHLDFQAKRIVATDKKRLYYAEQDFPFSAPTKKHQVYLERTDFLAWDKLEGDTGVALLDTHIALKIGSFYYITENANHQMPDWESIAKQKRAHTWRVGRDVQRIRDFIKSLPVENKKEGNGIALSFTPGSVTVTEIEGEKRLRLKDSGIKFSGIIRIDSDYLLGAFDVGLDTIHFGKNSKDAIQFTNTDKDRCLYVAPVYAGEAASASSPNPANGGGVKKAKRKSKKVVKKNTASKNEGKLTVNTREPVATQASVKTPVTNSLPNDLPVQVIEERDWVWAKFQDKPDALILEVLKSNQFRWSKKRKAWYKKSPGIPAWLIELAHKAALKQDISIEL